MTCACFKQVELKMTVMRVPVLIQEKKLNGTKTCACLETSKQENSYARIL